MDLYFHNESGGKRTHQARRLLLLNKKTVSLFSTAEGIVVKNNLCKILVMEIFSGNKCQYGYKSKAVKYAYKIHTSQI